MISFQHTGEPGSNWCQVRAFTVNQGDGIKQALRGVWVLIWGPFVHNSPLLDSNYTSPDGRPDPTCLIGIARPLPMLSARPSIPFFSLSGSLTFRDCGGEDIILVKGELAANWAWLQTRSSLECRAQTWLQKSRGCGRGHLDLDVTPPPQLLESKTCGTCAGCALLRSIQDQNNDSLYLSYQIWNG